MKKPLKNLSLVACCWFASFSFSSADELSNDIAQALQFSQTQLTNLAENVLPNNSRFVAYTNPSGVWQTQSSSTWCSGFIPGLFWYMYDYTGNDIWMTRAANWTEGVRSRATATDNDTGFQIFDSFGLGYFFTGETNDDYLDVLRTATNTFSTQRFNSNIGCFRAWTNSSSNPVTNPSITANTNNPNAMVFEVNIDMMMNIELPLYVGYKDSNQTYIDQAISHADESWEDLIREDGSTFHVVGYNADGTVDYNRTHQGWNTDSTWSRGQAWAVYGFTMVYRYTQLDRMLERAETCFDYFVAATDAQSTDAIPYSDFDAAVNSQNPRDTSAAAIVASAALELFAITGEDKYLNRAKAILTSLTSLDYLAQGTAYQSILRKGSEKWSEPEEGTVFGDYFFVEGSLRYLELFPIDTTAGKLVNISTRGKVGTGEDVLIGSLIIDSGTQEVLIQAVGQELAGVNGTLVDPVLEIRDPATNDLIATNDDWEDSQAQAITDVWAGNPPLTSGSTSSAILITLEPGSYSAIVSGKGGETGVALVEIYEVD